MTDTDWQPWLESWNRELLAKHDASRYNAFVDPAVTPDMIASGWLGAPGAPEADVAALEGRLGLTLPPSYRTFLLTSNGWLQPGVIVPRLFRVDEVQWFRDVEPETIDAWSAGMEAAGDAGEDEVLRDLPTALAVSARETIGTARYLLNPRVIDGEEWEALLFAHWIPGFHRYPSFRALMEDERSSFFER